MNKKIINLIFRASGYSIEMVFNTLIRDIEIDGTFEVVKIHLPYKKANIACIIFNIIFVMQKKYPINHITGDTHYVGLGLNSNNSILTIHDCVMMYRTSGIKKWLFKKLWLDMPIKNAKFVTTISNKTKNDILKFTNCPEEKIIVIPNPVNPIFKYTPSTFNKKKPRILHFGNADHKNTDRVISALKNMDVELVIIGKSALPTYESSSFIFLSNLSNQEIVEQYILCDIVLFPSWFEGFGMPIIEGQSVGRVVITSNIEPMTEVAGNGAHFVDPFDMDSIRNGVKKVIDDAAYRNVLISLGLENIKKYQSEVIAQQYLNLYKKIIAKNV
ncbi:MAG: glycosyltransferase family 4 protein [Chitinophagales bacterium]|nr:glycosyltransferase family 4 protein [Chitinophagales bacterium]